MLKPYDMLTRCQVRLNDCELPAIDKVRLEMYIVRIKLNLLEYEAEVNSNYSDNGKIKDLYDQISHICRGDVNASDVREITLNLQNFSENMQKPKS